MNNQKGFAPMVVIAIIIVVIAVGGYFVIKSQVAIAPTQSPTPTPTNTSTPVPTSKTTSGIFGKVMTGPTCPVQRVGDPSCDDKPYQGVFIVEIFDGVTKSEYVRFSTNATGNYSVKLPPGDYIIVPAAKVGISTQSQYVTVRPEEMKEFNFTLDTGIR